MHQHQYFVYFHDFLKVDVKDKIKLLNSWFVANELSLSVDKTCYSTSNLPRLVRRTQLVTEARFLSVQMDQTPGVYLGRSFYLRIYCIHVVLTTLGNCVIARIHYKFYVQIDSDFVSAIHNISDNLKL